MQSPYFHLSNTSPSLPATLLLVSLFHRPEGEFNQKQIWIKTSLLVLGILLLLLLLGGAVCCVGLNLDQFSKVLFKCCGILFFFLIFTDYKSVSGNMKSSLHF